MILFVVAVTNQIEAAEHTVANTPTDTANLATCLIAHHMKVVVVWVVHVSFRLLEAALKPILFPLEGLHLNDAFKEQIDFLKRFRSVLIVSRLDHCFVNV